MLLDLHVKDLALIEDVWLELGAGLTVLTGETGAGKTVLVGALKLLLGERADATCVRHGANEALIEGRFVLDGTEHVLKRRIGADGRSRCVIDGEMATVGALADLIGDAVDLHGQHEHQGLLSANRHASYLDRYVGDDAVRALDAYQRAFAGHRQAVRAYDDLTAARADTAKRIDELRFVLDEIRAVDPKPGEDVELRERLTRLRHAGALVSAAESAWEALKGDGAALDLIGQAERSLRTAGSIDSSLQAISEDLQVVSERVNDLGLALRSYASSIEHDPASLEHAEARLDALARLARKHGGSLEAVLALAAEAEEELARIESGEAGVEAARERMHEAEAELRECGERLMAVREEGADAFVEALRRTAADLALPSAVFEVSFERLPFERWTADGPHRVEFLFSPSKGERPRPLARIASGGEISRVMLALKGVLGEADNTPVLVFDEVDTGIGGATAVAVGARLKALASAHQVLVVTHLAQVAAFADRHIVVAKGVNESGREVTQAREVCGEARVAEIARMLSGGATETGLRHARELLASAGR